MSAEPEQHVNYRNEPVVLLFSVKCCEVDESIFVSKQAADMATWLLVPQC